MKEYFEIISGPAKHFVFHTAKEVCEHLAQNHTYMVIENYYDASDNATLVRLDVPALHSEVSAYVMKVTRCCADDFTRC